MVPDESLPAKETIGDHIYLNQRNLGIDEERGYLNSTW